MTSRLPIQVSRGFVVAVITSSFLPLVVACGAEAASPDGGLDATNESDVSSCDAGMVTCTDGACPTVLAACQGLPTTIVADDANIYWTNLGTKVGGGGNIPPTFKGGSIAKCLKAGCNTMPSSLVSVTENFGATLATNGADVYFSAIGTDAGTTQLFLCPVDGCASAISMLNSAATALALDAANLYWTTGPEVLACALTNCVQPTTLWQDSTKQVTAFAIDSTNVYWGTSAGSGGMLMKCAKTGCGTTPFVVGSIVRVDAMALDDTNVYAAGQVNTQSAIVKCAKTGCGTPTIIVPNFTSSALATDGISVYWAAGGAIYKCPTSGCSVPSVFASDGLPTTQTGTSIVLDSTSVYWSDPATGRILMLSK